MNQHRANGPTPSAAGASKVLRAGLTPYHASFFSYELTKRSASGSIDRLAGALADAQVDLNPHQVDAALFALSNPLSRGVILADEVGLGKTIEAGLLLSQRWAERQRRLLVIVPANLRKQWAQEMADKFHLPSAILESKSFDLAIKSGNLNPFEQSALIICSYHFARSKAAYVKQTRWDLIVLDEAHRLRNVYKPSSRIAQSIKSAIEPYPKVLLTATPLQNSLLELFGLVSIVDEYVFGDIKSFRTQFVRPDEQEFIRLKERLNTVCKRTLRRQVLEYVKYTNRHALVQEFVPFEEEERLYDLVSAYLQQPRLYALPPSQRQMMTLILRKLIASSTYAISGTLDGLVRKLETLAPTTGATRSEDTSILADDENDLVSELEEDWDDDETEEHAVSFAPPTTEQLSEIRAETAQLREFAALARSIVKNSKGEVLLTALRRGFEAARKAKSSKDAPALQQKAIIFTESRRTQDYLLRVLQETEFKDKIVLFNGTNADELSKTIYRRWIERNAGTDRISGSPSADMRAALVECFRDDAAIMIATEAAAEGVNLQFCNLVVNYDLPWNPQRIEQRIGRCHRYGQKHDVVVVNFLNKQNAADVRVYELLDEKFRLFNGVFGASDEVLGAIESGVDFEKRIAGIYQKCRTPKQIEFEFNQLRADLETEIAGVQDAAREKLLDNFDQEVIEKVRIESRAALDHFNSRLWELTRFLLAEHAEFDDSKFAFELRDNPFPGEAIHPGPYRLGKEVEGANIYRVGHPLAQRLLESAKELAMPVAEITFDLTGSGKRIAILESHRGSSGWLTLHRLKVEALEVEEELIFAATTDHGGHLDADQCRRLFDLDAIVGALIAPSKTDATMLQDAIAHERRRTTDEMTRRDGSWFDTQIDKMEHWAEDLRATLKVELANAEDDLKGARKAARCAPTLPEKLERQREVRRLEAKRDDAWREFDRSGRDLDSKKEALLDDISKRLEQETDERKLFTVRWHLV